MYDQFITVPAELSVSSELKFSDGQFSYWQKIFSAFKHKNAGKISLILRSIQLTAAWRREAYLRICVTEEHGCASDDETTTVELHCSKTHHHFIFSVIERKLQRSIRI